MIRPIPTTKIVCTGNLPAARSLIGLGKEQLNILKKKMSLAGPRGLTEDFRTVKPYSNVVIECWKSFKHQEIHIHVEPVCPVPAGEKGKTKDKYKCLCLPCFSLGRIVAVDPDDTDDTDSFLAELEETRFLYNIEVCSQEFYILLEDVMDANYGRYYKGQTVLVSIGEPMSSWDDPLDPDRTCLLNSPRFDTIMVSPIITSMMSSKWIRQ